MVHVFDDLISLQRAKTRPNPRDLATAWLLRLAGNIAVGVAIGVGIAVGRALAG